MDALVIRKYDMLNYGEGRNDLIKFCENSTIPIINALDCKDHPSQVLADLITLKERWRNNFRKKTVLLTWGYSRRQKSLGVSHSWLLGASLLGMNLRVAYPKGFDLDPEYVNYAENASKLNNSSIEFSNDLSEACEGVDCIYAKNWKSLSMTPEEETKYKESIRNDWIVDDTCFKKANPKAAYMDCLPSIDGEEASASVRRGKQSIVLEQAHNRIYANQAILSHVLSMKLSSGTQNVI